MEFPTIVYKLGGPNRGPSGKTYKYISVADKKEYDESIRNGWLSSLADACKKEDAPKSKAKKVVDAIGDSVETKSGKKFVLGKSGVVKRKEDYEKE